MDLPVCRLPRRPEALGRPITKAFAELPFAPNRSGSST